MVKKNFIKKEKLVKAVKLSNVLDEIKIKKIPKVLIIESHVDTAISISTILDFKGFRTFQAYNRKDGLQIAKIEHPDLIILNPIIDGVEHQDLIEILSNTKIILLKLSDSGKIYNPKKNILGVLDKPVSSNELLKMIDNRI